MVSLITCTLGLNNDTKHQENKSMKSILLIRHFYIEKLECAGVYLFFFLF